MKNFYSLFHAIIILLAPVSLFAQVENGLPNNGLTHRITSEEKMLMNNYAKGIMVTSPPAAPVRNIAEFEPAEAVIIAYKNGFGLPYSVIRDLSNTGKVIIACASSSQTTALNLLNSNSVNTANCSFLTTALDSWWTRDYTGWFIADNNDQIAIVDFTYNRPRPNDDAVAGLEASLLGITMYGMDLVHTGGNYMCDGFNNGISTDLVSDENSLSDTQIDQLMLDYLGIINFMIRPDAQGEYIKHIDCWAKLLAPDKILVDSVPATDGQYDQYEAAAAFFASTNCAYGYPYKVYRPLISGSSETNAEPYSNSYIFNNRVFVPLGGYSASHDSAALNCYRKAMPGYIVKGYTSSGAAEWLGTDALHCRTHEIADRNMLYIEHLPLYGLINSSTGYDINAKVVSYGGHALEADFPKVVYKVNQGLWDSIVMTDLGSNQFTANIPTQNSGDTVFYFIDAKDVTGKMAYHALMGKADPHFFIADGTFAGIEENISDPFMSFFTYPNPSNGDFIIFLKSNYSEKAEMNIYSSTGQKVYNESFILDKGNSMQFENITTLSKGVYLMEVKSVHSIQTKSIVIK